MSDLNRLANPSFGFVAVDGGIGYTYLDRQTGNEFSLVGGLTYSFINRDLQYILMLICDCIPTSAKWPQKTRPSR